MNLAGPESLTRAQLYVRAAQVLGNSTKVRSIPIFLGYTMAWLLELFMAEPPVTRAMLGVLDHDDDIQVDKALRLLEIEKLTPLDVMLRQALPRTVLPHAAGLAQGRTEPATSESAAAPTWKRRRPAEV